MLYVCNCHLWQYCQILYIGVRSGISRGLSWQMDFPIGSEKCMCDKEKVENEIKWKFIIKTGKYCEDWQQQATTEQRLTNPIIKMAHHQAWGGCSTESNLAQQQQQKQGLQ